MRILIFDKTLTLIFVEGRIIKILCKNRFFNIGFEINREHKQDFENVEQTVKTFPVYFMYVRVCDIYYVLTTLKDREGCSASIEGNKRNIRENKYLLSS